jgi:ATP-dependent Clp protease ATP-binding subunit ClpA
MRIDKLTTKFQEALADAQSLAAGRDNQYIEPVHVLAALLAQQDGSARSLMSRAGVHVQALQGALNEAISRLPQVTGTGGDIQIGRELGLLNQADKEAQKRATRSSPARCSCSPSPTTRAKPASSRAARPHAQGARSRDRRGARRLAGAQPGRRKRARR